MSKKDIKIAELEADIERLKESLIEEQMLSSRLIKDNQHLRDRFSDYEKSYEKFMSEAKLKNDALISAIKSKNTELFICNDETYSIKELTFNKKVGSVDTLTLELVKVDTLVSYNGGLIGAMQEAIKNVGDNLKVAFFGENNKED